MDGGGTLIASPAWIPLAVVVLSFLGDAIVFGVLWIRQRQSVPEQIAEHVAELTRRCQYLDQEVAATKSAWASYREGIDGVLEAMAETEERTEKNRRRAASAESRARRSEPNGGVPTDPRLALLQQARGMGIDL